MGTKRQDLLHPGSLQVSVAQEIELSCKKHLVSGWRLTLFGDSDQVYIAPKADLVVHDNNNAENPFDPFSKLYRRCDVVRV